MNEHRVDCGGDRKAVPEIERNTKINRREPGNRLFFTVSQKMCSVFLQNRSLQPWRVAQREEKLIGQVDFERSQQSNRYT